MHMSFRIGPWALAASPLVGCGTGPPADSVDARLNSLTDILDTDGPEPDVTDTEVGDTPLDAAEDPSEASTETADSADARDASEDPSADGPALTDTPIDGPVDALGGSQDSDADSGADSDTVDAIAEVETGDVLPDLESDAPKDPPFSDLTIGPYPSAFEPFVNSASSLTATYDSSITYTHVAAQGYALQAIGHVLWAAR
jgi:hypothetical protein